MFQKERAPTRKEVEDKIRNVGDYVKLDYLQVCLKKNIDFDTKKFVYIKLAELYEAKKMYLEAARLVRISTDINTSMENKIKDYVRSMILYIKAGNFEEAELTSAKAAGCAKEAEKIMIRERKKEEYLKMAQEYMSKDKRNNALKAYEQYLTLPLNNVEKLNAQKEVLNLYNQLGKIQEYGRLRQNLQNGK